MSTETTISVHAHLRSGACLEQAVEAMAPLLQETGHSQEAIIEALLACVRSEKICGMKTVVHPGGWRPPLNVWAARGRTVGFDFSGQMGDDLHDLAQKVASALGPLTARAGEITVVDEETGDRDNTSVVVFGPSPEAIEVYRFGKARDQALALLAEFIEPNGCDELLEHMNRLNFVHRRAHDHDLDSPTQPQKPKKPNRPGLGPGPSF